MWLLRGCGTERPGGNQPSMSHFTPLLCIVTNAIFLGCNVASDNMRKELSKSHKYMWISDTVIKLVQAGWVFINVPFVYFLLKSGPTEHVPVTGATYNLPSLEDYSQMSCCYCVLIRSNIKLQEKSQPFGWESWEMLCYHGVTFYSACMQILYKIVVRNYRKLISLFFVSSPNSPSRCPSRRFFSSLLSCRR